MNNEYIMRFKVHYRVMKERKLKESKKEKKKKTRSLKSLEKRNGITQTVGSDKHVNSITN